LLQIAAFDPSTVQNAYLIEEQKLRVEPLVKICLQWGRTGIVPEKMILSHDPSRRNPTVAKSRPKTLLRKQIKRSKLRKGLRLMQLRAILKRPSTTEQGTQTFELNQKFVETKPKLVLKKRLYTLSLVVPSSIVDNA
jgi:hypothetical protein